MGTETQSYVLEFKEKGMRVVKGSISSFRSTADKTTRATSALKKAIIGLGSVLSTRKILQYTQAWQQHTNMLRLVTDSEKELISVRNELNQVSRETRSDMIATGKLYQRLSFQQDNLGASYKDLIAFTRASNIALAATGANASETRSVLLQLGQAMGTAAVNGDEFRSIAENAPRLLKAVADGMGIAIGDVKRLTSEGKLLTRDFFQAVLREAPKLESELRKMDVTLGQAAIIFENRLIKAVGLFGELTGLAKEVSEGIVTLSDYIDSIVINVAAAFLTLKAMFADMVKEEGIGATLMKTLGLAAELFWDVFAAGASIIAPIMQGAGKLFVDTIVNSMIEASPKLSKKFGLTKITVRAQIDKLDRDQIENFLNNVGTEQIQSKLHIGSPSLREVVTGPNTSDFMPEYSESSKQAAARLKDINAETETLQQNLIRLEALGLVSSDAITQAAAGLDFTAIVGAQKQAIGIAFDNITGKLASFYDTNIQGSKDFKAVFDANINKLTETTHTVDDLQSAYDRLQSKLGESPDNSAYLAAISEFGDALETYEISLDGLLAKMDITSTVGSWGKYSALIVESTELLEEMLALGIEPTMWDNMKAGVISFKDNFNEAFNDMNENVMSFAEIMASTVTDAISGVSDELTELVTGGEADFKKLAGSIIKDLIRMMIQAQITKAVMMFTGGGGTAAVPTPSSNQFGGLIGAGELSTVNERPGQQELFVPNTAGRVIPNPKTSEPQSIRIVNQVSGDAVLQGASDSVIDKIIMNSMNRNSTSMRGVLA